MATILAEPLAYDHTALSSKSSMPECDHSNGYQPNGKRTLDVAHSQRELGNRKLSESGVFRWICDITGFSAEEVKIEIDGNRLTVIAEHSTIADDESLYRLTKRQVTLPKNTNRADVQCFVDEQSKLHVHVPRGDYDETCNAKLELWGPDFVPRVML
ncbi:small HSP21-like protein [Aphelenchoides avenae]|nr:small HSP21-like protein [Aphelenchus avenae]